MENIYSKYLTESSATIVEYSSYTLSELRAFIMRKAENYGLYMGDGDINFSLNEKNETFSVIFYVEKFDKASKFLSREVEKKFGLKSKLEGNKLVIDLKQGD